MSTVTAYVLDVPGARLHVEEQGSGPTLLMIPGGPTDSRMFAAIAPLLAEDRTVLTYDPRGLCRSASDDDGRPITVEGQADDVHALLTRFAAGPVQVFGNSGGAITGLSLVARYPGSVHTLVAHEPPLVHLLPEAAEIRADCERQLEIYRREGPATAMAAFLARIGVLAPGAGSAPPAPEQQNAITGMVGAFDVFFARMVASIWAFRPDIDALRVSGTRIVVAGGTTSRGQLAQRAAGAFAEQLGTPLIEVPGDHGGFDGEAQAFAPVLRSVLDE